MHIRQLGIAYFVVQTHDQKTKGEKTPKQPISNPKYFVLFFFVMPMQKKFPLFSPKIE